MRMYGDLVNGLCHTAFLLVYMGMWDTCPAPGSRNIAFAFLITASCCWFSYLKHNATASALACLGMSASVVSMNLYRWPFTDEVVVLPPFLWSLLVITGNVNLSFAYKAGMACVAFGTALTVSMSSPFLQVSDVLPLLLGATSVHILFSHFYSCQPEPRILRAHAASLILAGTFAYHTSSEIVTVITSPGYATQGGYSILKAGFFASVGLVAAGAFRREIAMNEAFEILVQDRAKEISKQAERLLLVGLALEASETAIAITDHFQKVVWSNDALSKLTGMSESELQTRKLSTVLRSEDLHLCFQDRKSTTVIMVGHRNIAVEVTSFPDDQNKDACGSRFLVALKDITEQRARKRAEKTAERKAVVAKAMSDSMETLTHELRTPLQGVMGITSMLLDDHTLSVDAQESLTVVMTSSRLLLTLINNLLDVRKCDADMMDEFQLDEVSMRSALSDAVDFCKPFAIISNVDLKVNLEGAAGVYAESNFLRFQQIMINLISNAIKYTAKCSAVSVGVEVMTLARAKADIKRSIAAGPHQSYWDGRPWNQINVAVISVSDYGAGIARDGADSLFGKFSQLDSSPTNRLGDHSVSQPSGTGLGLNLCTKFVKRMKGDIWVNNNRDRGCCFSFYLPLVSGDRTSISRPQLAGEKASVTPNGNGVPAGSVSTAAGYRVLLVDDTVINLKVLGRMLIRLGVEKVETVDSGSSALEALKKDDYNMVLTDMQMPGMSGTELSDAIRRSPDAEKLVVVGITAEVNESLAARCRNSGIAHVLTKPITSNELKAFFETVAGQLKPIGSKLAITRDKIFTVDAVTRATADAQDADKRCVVKVQDETVDEIEAGLDDSDNFDCGPAPLGPEASANNVQEQSMGDDTVSTFAKSDGSRSTTCPIAVASSISRLSTMEISVAGILEELLGLKASINELWLKQQGTNSLPQKRHGKTHTNTTGRTTNSRLSTMETSIAGIQKEVLGLKASFEEPRSDSCSSAQIGPEMPKGSQSLPPVVKYRWHGPLNPNDAEESRAPSRQSRTY